MYISGRKVQKPKKRHKLARALVALFIVVAILALLYWLLSRPNLSSDGSDGAVRQARFAEVPKKHIKEPYFEFDIPSDWKEESRKTHPYRVITWVGKARESIGRSLDIYVDTIPPNFAVNRLVPVSADGNRLKISETSANCLDFTKNYARLTPAQQNKLPPTPSSWQGVRFICDAAHLYRNVSATGSKDGLNRITLTGETGGKHNYFIVYTDHGSRKDDEVFSNILESFRVR